MPAAILGPMDMCDACRTLKTAGRRTPPHSALVAVGPVRSCSVMGMRADEQDYRCNACGQRWMHETGNSGYGWIAESADAD
ncbi:hypothetical protein GCM10009743_45680 [Kribbella swartbergensis]